MKVEDLEKELHTRKRDEVMARVAEYMQGADKTASTPQAEVARPQTGEEKLNDAVDAASRQQDVAAEWQKFASDSPTEIPLGVDRPNSLRAKGGESPPFQNDVAEAARAGESQDRKDAEEKQELQMRQLQNELSIASKMIRG